LRDLTEARQTLFCPSFPEVDRRVFQGHLFADDQLISESPKRHDPLTPMIDPNLVQVLQRQTPTPVGLLPQQVVSAGLPALDERLANRRLGHAERQRQLAYLEPVARPQTALHQSAAQLQIDARQEIVARNQSHHLRHRHPRKTHGIYVSRARRASRPMGADAARLPRPDPAFPSECGKSLRNCEGDLDIYYILSVGME